MYQKGKESLQLNIQLQSEADPTPLHEIETL